MARRKARRKRFSAREVFNLRWSRFDYDRTPQRDREWLRIHMENFVSCHIPPPSAFGLVVSTICDQATKPVFIEFLSLQLQAPVFPRGVTAFTRVWDMIDDICSDYPDLQWWISNHRLIIDTSPSPVQDFYQIAGKLMCEMRGKNPVGSRLSQVQFLEITDQLEKFPLLESLSKQFRQRLALWNQRSQKDVIRTFSQAITAKRPNWLHRETLRVLYRAEEKFRKSRSRSIGPYA
jgi:hypothetical protein